MRVLIIQTGTISDFLFSTPLIRCLKEQIDNVRIEVVSSVSGTSMLSGNSNVDAVHTVHSFRALIKNLSREKFDYIIDLDSNFRSLFLSIFLKGNVLRKFLLPDWYQRMFMKGETESLHKVDQYFRVTELLGVANDEKAIEFTVPYKDEVPLEWLPSDYQHGFVALCIGADYPTRRLPLNKLIELCDKINKPIILMGNKEIAEEGEKVENFFKRQEPSRAFEEGLLQLNKKTRVYNGCGKFNLNQQASLVKQAKYVFTYDNEFIAIASAYNKEVISIWGNTVPGAGGYPYLTSFTLLENTRLKCRPCSAKGYSTCPLGHFKCMKEISFDFYVT